ncbi:hypothetical protein [Pseudomonas sp. MBLB4136]|uniref:hypothetical protein n=1 Tax=Pseudomonas sp. MBLB4136 TaxID=3451558 RepID=UPI003F74ECAC
MLRKYFLMYSLHISLLLFVSHANGAGWYQVKNYSGHIGKYPVTISLQHYKNFGSGLEFNGSYYYNKQLKPIPLYGKQNKDGNIELCETHSSSDFNSIFIQGTQENINTSACHFLLTLTTSGAVGEWRRGNKKLTVNLSMIGSLDNTENGNLNGTMEVPFWGQTLQHSFIGVYEPSNSGVKITKIKVINRNSEKLVQEFNPQESCDFGFFMTPIFMNIDSLHSTNREEVILNCGTPQGGDFVIYSFDKKQKKFIPQTQ